MQNVRRASIELAATKAILGETLVIKNLLDSYNYPHSDKNLEKVLERLTERARRLNLYKTALMDAIEDNIGVTHEYVEAAKYDIAATQHINIGYDLPDCEIL